ncbi:MAG TPA: glycosyltransferase family 4 protein [Actinomycetota bacterium]|nr:glycosyltransferase family 4 protein [Actinomycetota bacterium]
MPHKGLKPLRIAMVAPPWFQVPPEGYGGIEWMAYWLTEGLVALGHEVTLIGAGQNNTSANFHSTFEEPPSLRLGEPLPEAIHHAKAMQIIDDLDVDVIHDHTLMGPLLARTRKAPTVITAHGPVDGEVSDYFTAMGDKIHLVAISEAQRRKAPQLAWAGTVRNAIPVDDYTFRSVKEDFVLFLGRMSPEKGVHLAIEAAREAGHHLVIAAKCNEPLEYEYLEEEVRPRLGPWAEWIGEADAVTKKDLLSRARCLLFPIRWEEPFGIVMVEALASGTPVVALTGGSVPEVVLHGETGYVFDKPDELVKGIEEAALIDPEACRDYAKKHFDIDRMVLGYESLYRQITLGERLERLPQIVHKDQESLKLGV